MSVVGGEKKVREWAMGKERFEARMPHHDGIKALWETKWEMPCKKSVYPFHDGKFEDFAPIFEHLIANNINDAYSNEYTEAFFPIAEALTSQADELLAPEDKAMASEFYLRAACLYRIARFPYVGSSPEHNTPSKARAWKLQKEVYMRAVSAWSTPMEEVMVPYTHRRDGEGSMIPVYIRVPESADASMPCPVVILMTGLDGYRPDNTIRSNEFLSRGCASLIVEIPGTADCPADAADPKSPDRLWDSVLGWMKQDGRFDMGKVLVWGLSSGGYYAVRIAYTHKDRIMGSIAQGAGTHHFFDENWLDKADGHEYPFNLSDPLSKKYGYDSVEEFKKTCQKKFSLLETGILAKPCTKLLLVNGTVDGLMPIEDSTMLVDGRDHVEGVFILDALHMGYPTANEHVYKWIDGLLK